MILDVLRMLPLCVNHVRALVGSFHEFYVKIHVLMDYAEIEICHEYVDKPYCHCIHEHLKPKWHT